MSAAKPVQPLSPALRVLLVAEVLLYIAGLMAYTFFAFPPHNRLRPLDGLLLFIAAAVPVGLNRLHGDNFADAGVRLDNVGRSAREVGLAALLMGLGTIAVGLAVGGFHWLGWHTLGDKAALYLIWGPVQQYLLNSFGLRRLLQAGLERLAAVVLIASLFALVHSPNWPLVGVTFLGGMVWCWLFLRTPNVFILGLCHGLLAILIYYAWPIAWLQQLTIGRMYMERVGH